MFIDDSFNKTVNKTIINAINIYCSSPHSTTNSVNVMVFRTGLKNMNIKQTNYKQHFYKYQAKQINLKCN